MTNKKTVSERLRMLIKGLNETQLSFSNKLTISQSTIATAIMRDSELSSRLIVKIIKTYPYVNIDWLLTGEGNMFKTEEERMPPGDLLKLYLKEKGITKKEFAGKMGISLEEADKHLSLKDGNMDYMLQWAKNLETGTTELFMSADSYLMYMERECPKNAPATIENIQETRPRIPFNAAAGSVSIALSGVGKDDSEEMPFISAFSNYSYTILVKGDSMEPEFKSGDELACLQLTNSKAHFIQWGKYHVLDTEQGVIVKRIYNDGEYILCKSENRELYSEFKIRKDEVYNLGLVIGVIRRF